MDTYHCVICMREVESYLVEDQEDGELYTVYDHDEIEHPIGMMFDDEDRKPH